MCKQEHINMMKSFGLLLNSLISKIIIFIYLEYFMLSEKMP